ncbi:Hypothetical predicted protein, partial [Paramuricea clavata]
KATIPDDDPAVRERDAVRMPALAYGGLTALRLRGVDAEIAGRSFRPPGSGGKESSASCRCECEMVDQGLNASLSVFAEKVW